MGLLLYNTTILPDDKFFHLLSVRDCLPIDILESLKKDKRYLEDYENPLKALCEDYPYKYFVKLVYSNPAKFNEVFSAVLELDKFIQTMEDIETIYYRLILDQLLDKAKTFSEIELLKFGIDDIVVNSILRTNMNLQYFKKGFNFASAVDWKTRYLRLVINLKISMPFMRISNIIENTEFYVNYVSCKAPVFRPDIISFMDKIKKECTDFWSLLELLSTLEYSENSPIDMTFSESSEDRGNLFTVFGDETIYMDDDEFTDKMLSCSYESLSSYFGKRKICCPSEEVLQRLVMEKERLVAVMNTQTEDMYYLIFHGDDIFVCVSNPEIPDTVLLVELSNSSNKEVIVMNFKDDIEKCDIKFSDADIESEDEIDG